MKPIAPAEAESVADAEADKLPESRTISAPVGRVKAFKTWANKVFVKIAPSAGKVLSRVATDYVEKKLGL